MRLNRKQSSPHNIKSEYALKTIIFLNLYSMKQMLYLVSMSQGRRSARINMQMNKLIQALVINLEREQQFI